MDFGFKKYPGCKEIPDVKARVPQMAHSWTVKPSRCRELELDRIFSRWKASLRLLKMLGSCIPTTACYIEFPGSHQKKSYSQMSHKFTTKHWCICQSFHLFLHWFSVYCGSYPPSKITGRPWKRPSFRSFCCYISRNGLTIASLTWQVFWS